MVITVRFVNIILVALISGVVVGIWLGYNPKNFSAATYVEQQQGAIKALNTLMPVLGLIATVVTVLSAFLQKDDKSTFVQLLLAAALLLVSGLVTRFGNQPINGVVMTWNVNSIPENWTQLRDKWWSYHLVRTAASMASLVLVVWSGMRK